MLGQDLMSALERDGAHVTGLARHDLDITDGAAVHDAVNRTRPDVVVNCAAWTAVDEAEAHETEALAVNGGGPANLATVCATSGARLIQVSTDYVFDGTASRPYAEDAVAAPSTAYGRTKLAGETAVLQQLPGSGYVVRTAWLYAASGPNFVRTMIRFERERPDVEVVDDQLGQPTWTIDVVRQVIALMRSGAKAGVYHATSSGQTTWYGLAREVFRLLEADPGRVRAIASSMLRRRPAARPAYSVLGHDRWAQAGLAPISGWQASLGRALPALVAAERAETAQVPRVEPA